MSTGASTRTRPDVRVGFGGGVRSASRFGRGILGLALAAIAVLVLCPSLALAQSLTITPKAHYHIQDVQVNGASVGATDIVQLGGAGPTETVSATFAIDTNRVTAVAGKHGSVSPTTQDVAYGSNATVTITPDAHYRVADVVVDGCSVGATSTYVFQQVATPHTVTASFVATDTFTITIVQYGGNGTTSPLSTLTVPYGEDATLSLTPNPGYWSVVNRDHWGMYVAGLTTYYFYNVQADHLLEVWFKPIGIW